VIRQHIWELITIVILVSIVGFLTFMVIKKINKDNNFNRACSKTCGEYVVHICYESDGVRYAVCGNQGVRKVETENDSPN